MKWLAAAIWFKLVFPFPNISYYNLCAMEFLRVPLPMRWQLCAHCNEIIYVIVSPDECPKCGKPIIVRSAANLQTTMCTMPRFQHPSVLRPRGNLHITTPAIARPDVPKPIPKAAPASHPWIAFSQYGAPRAERLVLTRRPARHPWLAISSDSARASVITVTITKCA